MKKRMALVFAMLGYAGLFLLVAWLVQGCASSRRYDTVGAALDVYEIPADENVGDSRVHINDNFELLARYAGLAFTGLVYRTGTSNYVGRIDTNILSIILNTNVLARGAITNMSLFTGTNNALGITNGFAYLTIKTNYDISYSTNYTFVTNFTAEGAVTSMVVSATPGALSTARTGDVFYLAVPTNYTPAATGVVAVTVTNGASNAAVRTGNRIQITLNTNYHNAGCMSWAARTFTPGVYWIAQAPHAAVLRRISAGTQYGSMVFDVIGRAATASWGTYSNIYVGAAAATTFAQYTGGTLPANLAKDHWLGIVVTNSAGLTNTVVNLLLEPQ